jgi:nicotinamide mononucleotide transporter
MTEWFINNLIEVTGALFALVYLFLEIRQKWFMWIIGFISSSFYIYIFFEAKLYAEMGLNMYYAIMAIYGIYCWKFAKKNETAPLKVTKVKPKVFYTISLLTIALFGLIVAILIRFTDSPVPYPDALIASLSITATWMVTRKILEHWLLWIFVNFFSVGLYIYQELYPTAILFIIYGSMSIVGLIEWKKSIISIK